MELLEFLGEFNYLIEMIYGATVFVITWFVKDLGRNSRQRKLKKLLALSTNETQLSLPVRRGSLNDQNSTRLNWEYVTYDEALVLYEVHKLIGELDGNIFLEPGKDQKINPKNNLICVGGPMANLYVRKLIKTKLSAIKHKWQNESDVRRTKEYEDFIYTDNSNPMGGLKVGTQEILFKPDVEGYILLARLVGKHGKRSENDFADSEHGTVHVMYGVNAKTTLAAVKSLTTHRNEIYKRLKHRTGHYLAVIMCDVDGELDFSTFMDLTEEAFPEIKADGGQKK